MWWEGLSPQSPHLYARCGVRHPGCVPAVMLRRQLEELVAVYPTAKLWQMQVRHHAVCVLLCVCGGAVR